MSIYDEISLRDRTAPSPEEIVSQLRGEFLIEARERLESLDAILNDFHADLTDSETANRLIRQEAHNLKGMGATFGFPFISRIMHSLEDYLEANPIRDLDDLYVTQKFIDPVDSIVESGTPLTEEQGLSLMENLPSALPGGREEETPVQEQLCALLITHSRTIGKKVSKELKSYGFTVELVGRTENVIPRIVRLKPTIVLCSFSMDGLNGVDLARAIISMSDTRHIPIALITSYPPDAPELSGLPSQVPIVQLGPEVETEISKALTALEFRWPVA